MYTMNKQDERKNFLTCILSPITKIYKQEQPKALLAFLAYFLLMTSYYIIRPTRSSLFMKEWGTSWMPVFYLIIAIIVLCMSFLYNFLVTRFKRSNFIRLVFGGVLISFFCVWFIEAYPNNVFISISDKALTTFWYIWICAYILFLTSLFWSFNHDLHTAEQSRRIYPLILLGAQFGVIFGSRITKWLLNGLSSWSEKYFAKRIEMNNYDLILISSFFLILTWIVLEILHHFDAKKQQNKTSTNENLNSKKESKKDNYLTGLKTVLSNKYAACLAAMVVFSMLSLTVFDYQYKHMIEKDVTSKNVFLQEQDFNNKSKIKDLISKDFQNIDENISNVLYSCEPKLKEYIQSQEDLGTDELCHMLNNIIQNTKLHTQIDFKKLPGISVRTLEILGQTEDAQRCNRIILDNIFKKSLNSKRNLLESDAKERSKFLAEGDSWMGWLNIILLFLITPGILRVWGPGVTALFYPIACAIAAACFLFGMEVYTVRIFAIIISSLSYTMYLVAKETFYVPTKNSIRYQAKAVSDAFGYRLGDTLGGLVTMGYVFVFGINALCGLSAILFLVVIPWISVIIHASKVYKKLTSVPNSSKLNTVHKEDI